MPKKNFHGMDFYYEINGSGYPVILINGVFSTTLSWNAQVEALKKQFKVITYDCRDQGQTGFAKESYPFSQHIEDLNELMNQLDIPQAHIIGISYGATIATQFAYTYPEKVHKMVLISGLADVDPKTENTFVFLNKYLPDNTLQDYYRILMLLGLNHKQYNQVAQFIPQLAEEFNHRFHGNKENLFRLIRAAMQGQLPDLNKVKNLKLPVLIVAGENDNFVSPGCSIRMHDYIKGSILKIIRDCGHTVIIEAPDELNHILLNFL